MKIYTKEYGLVSVPFKIWIRAKLNPLCRTGFHQWRDLGDPCYCGSDNCFQCLNCGFETHD